MRGEKLPRAWRWGLLVPPLLLFTWCLFLMLSVRQLQTRVGVYVHAISGLTEVEEALLALESAVKAPAAASGSVEADWERLEGAYGDLVASLQPDDPTLRDLAPHLVAVSAAVAGREDAVRSAGRRPGGEGGDPELGGEALGGMAASAREAVRACRRRLAEVSKTLAVRWRSLSLLALLACVLSIGAAALFIVTDDREIARVREIEAALRASEREYRELFEQAHDAVLILAPENEVVLNANQRACELYGFERSELIGKSMIELSEENPRRPDPVQNTLQADGGYRFKTVQRRKDGSKLRLEIIASATEYRGRQVIVSINRDVTERHELEAQLRQAQKMEAIGKLAGGVAHDFNNLLTVILGRAELVLKGLSADGALWGEVDQIRGAAERAAALTGQLLAFSRRQTLRPRVLDLNGVVGGLSKMLGRVLGEDIELITALDQNLPRVEADSSQLEQVLMNLAINARDAMPEGGRLMIATSVSELGEPQRTASPSSEVGSGVRLTVTDTGLGMDEETLSRIFEPFFTTKEEGKGTGLGLSTVYGIVKQSGGTIRAESELGKGTAFKVYLPAASAAGEVPLPAPRAVTALHGSETILLVEDEPAVRALARQVLLQSGYTVLEAGRGSEALRLFEREKARIDLVVTDVVLAGMSGRELLERLRSLRLGLRALYLSGYTENMVVQRGASRSEVAFLEKPFSPTALLRVVREVLDATPGRAAEAGK